MKGWWAWAGLINRPTLAGRTSGHPCKLSHGGQGGESSACEWEPDGQSCLRGALGYTPQSHTLSSPRVASGPLAQDRGRRAGLLRSSGLEAGLSVCTCVPVCAGMSVCGVRAGGRQTGKGGSDAGMGGGKGLVFGKESKPSRGRFWRERLAALSCPLWVWLIFFLQEPAFSL